MISWSLVLMLMLVLTSLLAACDTTSSTKPFTLEEERFGVGCHYSANIGTLDSYCSR